MLDTVKANLFTVSGLIVSIIHVMLVVGLLSCWMFINVQVLGHDVSMSFPSEESIAKATKGRK